MRVTKIEIQKRRPDRRNIYADGVFFLGIGAETLIRAGLRTGDELTDERVAFLTSAETLLSAKTAALRLLSVRPRTQKEIRDRLREKEFGPEEIEKCVRDLNDAGLLNDGEFARMFIRDRMLSRPQGRTLVARKLLMLGIDKETVAAAFADTLQPGDQAELARKAAGEFLAKASKSRKEEDPRKKQQRLTAFLLRRGYTWDIVSAIVRGKEED